MKLAVVICGLFVIASVCPVVGESQQRALTAEVKLNVQYLLHLPKSYGADPAKKWPVIVFLHGSGERGNNPELVKVHGPPKLVEKDPDFPFIVLSPQCPDRQRWQPTILSRLLDEVLAAHAADLDRVYLTGLSLGGQGTWDWALAEPGRFAAIVPICGPARVRDVKSIKDIPTWVFHGAKDQAVELKQSEDIVAALEKAGGKPKFTVYPDAGHDSWTETYANPELYKWLLEQRRVSTPSGK